MKVFISWSLEPSLSIALALRLWLPKVVQFTEPWMSREDLESGELWNEQVATQLDETNYGIVCVTAANQERPWLNFEAGALAKRVVEPARVVPVCIDLEPAEVTGPLASFQGLKLDRDGMRKLVRDISARRENPMQTQELDELFDDTWHRLEAKVNEAKEKIADPKPQPRKPQDMLEELVERVRRIERDMSQPGLFITGPTGSGKSALLSRLLLQPPREGFTFTDDLLHLAAHGSGVRDLSNTAASTTHEGERLQAQEAQSGEGDGNEEPYPS